MKSIFNLFMKKTNKTLLGIDLTTHDIKIVELTKTNEGKFKIEGYACRPIPPGLIAEDIIVDTSQVGQIIKDMINVNKIQSRDVAICVPQNTVISKNIVVTGENEREIESEIENSGKKYISLDIEEVDFDFKVLYTQPDSQNKDVLLVACKKKNITTRDDTVIIAGLEPRIVDSESYVYERVYPLILDQVKHVLSLKDKNPNSILMVELFEKKLKVVLFNKDKVSYNEDHNIDLEKKYTTIVTGLVQTKVSENPITDYQNGVSNTLKKVLNLIQSDTHNNITCICFMGDKKYIDDAKDYVENTLQINCLIANPISNMEISNKIDIADLVSKSSLLVVACGLAMRENIYD